MCGIAEILLKLGARVSGSDLKASSITQDLQAKGLQFYSGHQAQNLDSQVTVVVVSTAVPRENAEVQKALSLRIPVISRAEALAEIMRFKRGIAIAGSHGKTTTTSLAATQFLLAGKNPTVVVGGRVPMMNSTACWGDGEWLIAEADESDGSFLKLTPEIAVITNIDDDHMDHFQNSESLNRAFLQFADRVPFYGAVVACADDGRLMNLLQDFRKRVFTYGFSADADVQIQDLRLHEFGQKTKFQIRLSDRFPSVPKELKLELNIPGEHNALNACAAVASGLLAGLSSDEIEKGLRGFAGVDRRFHFQRQVGECLIYDDYGHHPTEIRATLKMFRQQFPDKKLIVVFQPHRYSRTAHALPEFRQCFALAHEVFVTETYSAGEKPEMGISSQQLVTHIQQPTAHFLSAANIDLLRAQLQEPCVLLLLGAGDINKFAEKFLT